MKTSSSPRVIEPGTSADYGETIVEMNHRRVGGGAGFFPVADT
jgi:hypothetical protein